MGGTGASVAVHRPPERVSISPTVALLVLYVPTATQLSAEEHDSAKTLGPGGDVGASGPPGRLA